MSAHTDALAAELLALQNDNGLINPVDVVHWARGNAASQLHAKLEWDDAVAGERYRIWQVRALISVHIVDAQGERQFVSLSSDRPTGGYRPVSEVVGSVELREIMVADALAEVERLQKRYDRLTELSAVWQAADKVRERRRGAKAKAA